MRMFRISIKMYFIESILSHVVLRRGFFLLTYQSYALQRIGVVPCYNSTDDYVINIRAVYFLGVFMV